ncbi:MAG: MerR family transcriptional regulator [Candidatus Kapaibacterium sp.]
MIVQGEFFEPPRTVKQEIPEEEVEQTVPVDENVHRGLKDLAIPKLYYSISEVSRLTGLEQYVLRYWETEFDELRPQKNRAGNRIYANKDIKFILHIKDLLREKRYTIEGAKQILKDERQGEKNGKLASAEANGAEHDAAPVTGSVKGTITQKDLQEIKSALEMLRDIFSKPKD